MDAVTATYITFKTGWICAKYSDKPTPSTMKEAYDIMTELGINVKKGDAWEVVEKKIDDFLKVKQYDKAMKIL